MMMLFRRVSTILGHGVHLPLAEESPRMHMVLEPRRWTLEEMYELPEDGNCARSGTGRIAALA